MINEIMQLVEKNFYIAPIQNVSSVEGGFLSHNVAIQAGNQKYFLKKYRFKEVKRVKAAHEAKHYFSKAGVPAILPIQLRTGGTILQYEGSFYSLFPFVNGFQLQRGNLSRIALEAIAQMQGKIHLCGAAIKLPHSRYANLKNYQDFIDMAPAILDLIMRANKTGFDERAKELLSYKLCLANKYQETAGTLKIKRNHLVHGDYHEANIFFSQSNEVRYVFDWESTKIASREMQVIRSIELICFNQPKTYIPRFTEEDFIKARTYLASYHDVYQLRRGEFSEALMMRFLNKIMSLWVETTHYVEGSNRVDVFLEGERHLLKYYANHFDEFIQRMCDDILK